MIIYNFVKYIANRLIIWRSQVQALAGPPLQIKQLSQKLSCFFFCFANTLRTQRHLYSNMVFAHFHAFLSCEHVFSSDFILPISGKQNSFNPVRQIARNTPLPQFGIIIDQYAENNEARISVGNWLTMFAESQGQLNDYESERAYSEVEDIATGKYDHRLGKGGQGISM